MITNLIKTFKSLLREGDNIGYDISKIGAIKNGLKIQLNNSKPALCKGVRGLNQFLIATHKRSITRMPKKNDMK